MGDWDSAWNSAREGLATGRQIAETIRANRAREGFEGQRIGLEGKRLEDDLLTKKLERSLSQLKLDALKKNLEAAVDPKLKTLRRTVGPDGLPTTEMGVVPGKDDISVLPLPPEFNAGVVTAPGMTPSVMPKLPPGTQAMFGLGSGAAPAWKGFPFPVPSGTGAPAAGAPAAAGSPAPSGFERTQQMIQTGLDPQTGLPKLEMRYVWADNSAPKTKSVQQPGQPFPTIYEANLDPVTGAVDWKVAPYNSLQGQMTDRQKAVADSLAAMRIMGELESTIDKRGNFENSVPFIGDAQASAALDQLPIKLSIAMARAMNPGNAPTEGQIDVDKKYMVPMGLTVPNAKSLGAIENLKHDLNERVKEMGLFKDMQQHFADQGVDLHSMYANDKELNAAGAAGAIPNNAFVLVNGKLKKWVSDKP